MHLASLLSFSMLSRNRKKQHSNPAQPCSVHQARARELLKVGGEYYNHRPRAGGLGVSRPGGLGVSSQGAGFGSSNTAVEDDDSTSVAGESIASAVTFVDGGNDVGVGGAGVGDGGGGGVGSYNAPTTSPVGEVDRGRSWMSSDWFGADIVFFDSSPVALGGKSS